MPPDKKLHTIRDEAARVTGNVYNRNEALFYHALKHYYQQGLTYVEVGDGDELQNGHITPVRWTAQFGPRRDDLMRIERHPVGEPRQLTRFG